MSNFIEKAPNVGIENPVHFLPGDSHPERIQRIVRASPRSEPIREPKKILFVNLIEDCHHCVLDDLVLQRSDPQRTLSSIRLGNVGSLRRLRSIRALPISTWSVNPKATVCWRLRIPLAGVAPLVHVALLFCSL